MPPCYLCDRYEAVVYSYDVPVCPVCAKRYNIPTLVPTTENIPSKDTNEDESIEEVFADFYLPAGD